jgi:predicted transcriptional regulator
MQFPNKLGEADNPSRPQAEGSNPVAATRTVADSRAEPAPRSWTFLTNHGHVLIALSLDPEARIRDIAADVGITERAAQAILADLERDGYVTKIKEGRRNRYVIHHERGFRHPAESQHPISDLLRIFG